MLADTLSHREQDIGRQEALGKAHYTQILLIPDKLDPEITYRLAIKLAPVSETPVNAPIILTNRHIPLDLINQILIANKQSPSLEDEHAKAIRGDQD